MSSSKETDTNKSQHYSEVELTGSHFALQVALQTMKERCQRLQQRLSCLEEENSRLKLHKYDYDADIHCDNSSDAVKLQLEQLKEQVSQLTRQKSQLSHQIIMVVTENKQLWNRLSHMTKLNKSLGGHLSKISDTLNQHTSGPCHSSPKKSKATELKTSQENDTSPQIPAKISNGQNTALGKPFSEQNPPSKNRPTDGSLEEISLKLLNSIRLEKSELEHQYAQMVEIQNNTSPSYNLNTMGLSFIYEDENQAIKLIKEHCTDLEKMKQALLDQQSSLKSTVSKVTALREAGRKNCCHQCLTKHGKPNENDTVNEESANDNTLKLNEGEQKFKDQWDEDLPADKADDPLSMDQKETSNVAIPKEQMHICPMCGMKWSFSTPFDVFMKHVTDHFPPDNDFHSFGNEFEVL